MAINAGTFNYDSRSTIDDCSDSQFEFHKTERIYRRSKRTSGAGEPGELYELKEQFELGELYERVSGFEGGFTRR